MIYTVRVKGSLLHHAFPRLRGKREGKNLIMIDREEDR